MPSLIDIIVYILIGLSMGTFTTFMMGGFEATHDFTKKTNETEETA